MKQKFIEWFTNNNNRCSPAMEDDRGFVLEKTRHMFEAYLAGVAEGEARCAGLAAENAGLKECNTDIMKHVYRSKTYLDSSRVVDAIQGLQCAIERKSGKTPATDAFLAEVRAQHGESICASLLEKASEYDARAKEVDCHITDNRYRFAAAMFRGFAAQLRKGVQS